MTHEVRPNGPDTILTFFVYRGSEPYWVQGILPGTPSGDQTFTVDRFRGINLCPNCSGATGFVGFDAGAATLNLGPLYGTGEDIVLDLDGASWTVLDAILTRLTSP